MTTWVIVSIVLLWWAIGTASFLYSYSWDNDVRGVDLVFGLVFGTLFGPILLPWVVVVWREQRGWDGVILKNRQAKRYEKQLRAAQQQRAPTTISHSPTTTRWWKRG